MPNQRAQEHPGAALLRLSEAGDFVAWRRLFAPGGVIWHNTDLKDKSPDELVAGLTPVRKRATSWKYTVVQRVDFEGGFFQRFILDAELDGERKVKLAGCLSCEVRDGLITRLDEYVDSAALASLLAA